MISRHPGSNEVTVQIQAEVKLRSSRSQAAVKPTQAEVKLTQAALNVSSYRQDALELT
jgi:hypothetical protein